MSVETLNQIIPNFNHTQGREHSRSSSSEESQSHSHFNHLQPTRQRPIHKSRKRNVKGNGKRKEKMVFKNFLGQTSRLLMKSDKFRQMMKNRSQGIAIIRKPQNPSKRQARNENTELTIQEQLIITINPNEATEIEKGEIYQKKPELNVAKIIKLFNFIGKYYQVEEKNKITKQLRNNIQKSINGQNRTAQNRPITRRACQKTIDQYKFLDQLVTVHLITSNSSNLESILINRFEKTLLHQTTNRGDKGRLSIQTKKIQKCLPLLKQSEQLQGETPGNPQTEQIRQVHEQLQPEPANINNQIEQIQNIMKNDYYAASDSLFGVLYQSSDMNFLLAQQQASIFESK